MKFTFSFLFVLLSVSSIFAQNNYGLIPMPRNIQATTGHFVLSKDTGIKIPFNNQEVSNIAQTLANQLRNATGLNLRIADNHILPSNKSIVFLLNSVQNQTLGNEGYALSIKKNQIQIRANTSQGLFYGVQTLLQLLPKEIESDVPIKNTVWRVPCLNISDYPRFAWRGLMLDVSRHFFTKNEVKQYIDRMAKYKYNVFHWHLTDDQGWRIEIKSLPLLTQKGAWRVPRTGDWWDRAIPQEGEAATYGGFYGQDDIKEILAYAKERYISVLPEIDVPGHSLAMIAAYPELSSTRKNYPVNGGWKFYEQDDNSLDPSNPKVYEVLDKVFTEVAALFPNEYIHIGGDECSKKFWRQNPDCQALIKKESLKDEKELQSYFIHKLEKIVESKGKKIIGWDEILEGGLSPNATVMSWREMKGGIEAAKQGHPVIMTPWSKCYLDLYQGDVATEPKTYGLSRLKSAYNWNPVPEGIDPQLILGGQGNLWTESIPNLRHAQYMTWPRAMALAEVYWTANEQKNYDDFVGRVGQHFDRLDLASTNYARSMYEPIVVSVKKNNNGKLTVELDTEVKGLSVYYSTDNTFPDYTFPKYEKPIELPKGNYYLRLLSYQNNKAVGKIVSIKTEDLEKRVKK